MILRTIIILASAAAALLAQDDRAKRVDEIFQDWNKPGTPGAAVAVVQGGKLVLERGYGAAHLEYDVAITPLTVFHVASVSKQFTAMAVVLLEQDGKLSLEDDVHKYLAELPDYGHKITIRNLLQHTSGIRDQWQILSLAGWRLDDVITQKQILRMLFHQQELNFAPGTKHLYSNGGYTLAAEIVARVSGKSFPQFCDERIFRPLGMAHSHFHDDHRRIVRDRAYSYGKVTEGYQAEPLNYANVGATSLFTTAPDLVKWLDNFREPKVGGLAAVERLQEQAVLGDGKKIDYALGVAVGKYRGLQTIFHGGGDAGYRSYVVWFPEPELGVAVVSNLASFSPGPIANKVAAVFAGEKMTAEAVNPKLAAEVAMGGGAIEQVPVALAEFDEKDLAQYSGVYWSEELETQYTIGVKDGKLVADHAHHGEIALTPVAKGQFRGAVWFMQEVKFVRDASGRITGLTVGGGRVSAVQFVRKG
jgi:CubicO group peptidase (beta-lactamase class C family)